MSTYTKKAVATAATSPAPSATTPDMQALFAQFVASQTHASTTVAAPPANDLQARIAELEAKNAALLAKGHGKTFPANRQAKIVVGTSFCYVEALTVTRPFLIQILVNAGFKPSEHTSEVRVNPKGRRVGGTDYVKVAKVDVNGEPESYFVTATLVYNALIGAGIKVS